MADSKASRKVRPVTDAERKEALRMHREGESVRKIARHFNRAPSTISRSLWKAGVPVRRQATRWGPMNQAQGEDALRMFNEGMGVREIVRHFNVAPSTVSRLLRRAGENPAHRRELEMLRGKLTASDALSKARLRILEQAVASLKREVAELKKDMARLKEKVRRKKKKRSAPASSEASPPDDSVNQVWVS